MTQLIRDLSHCQRVAAKKSLHHLRLRARYWFDFIRLQANWESSILICCMLSRGFNLARLRAWPGGGSLNLAPKLGRVRESELVLPL